MEMTWCR